MKLVNIHNKNRTISLFCRDDNGKLNIKEVTNFFPYYYHKHLEGEYSSHLGEPLKKIFVSNPSDIRNHRTKDSYESDINFCNRYMIDKIKEIERTKIKYAFIDVEILANEFPNPNEAKCPISCISIYNSFSETIQSFYLGDYKTEYDMIADFIKYIQKEQFDLWLGWNFENFDMIYLMNRIPDFSKQVSPIGQERYAIKGAMYPAGISIIDYMLLDKKITLNRKKSYSLDARLQEVIGRGKQLKKVDFGILSPEIKTRCENDVRDMVEMEKKLQYIPLWDGIRRLSKVNFEDYYFNSRVIDMLLLQEAKERKIILPMKPKKEDEGKDFEGAFRHIYKKGALFDCGSYDIAGAYLNTIIELCLDPANIHDTPQKDTLPVNVTDRETNKIIATYHVKQNPNALLPSVAKKLLYEKNKFKKLKANTNPELPEYKDIKEKYDAYKSISLSTWGVIGNKYFRYYDHRVTSMITSVVRDLLYYIKNELEKLNYQIYYIDTDGLIIDDKGKNIVDILNKLVQQWSNNRFNRNTNIYFEYEGNYEKLLLLALCRYKGYLKTDTGIEEKTVGIEAKRKDSTAFIVTFQTNLINKILNKISKETIINWIKSEIKNFKSQPLQDIAFPCKLGRKIEDYTNVPIFVRAMQETEGFNPRVGENFYYVYVKPEFYHEEKKVIEYYQEVPGKREGTIKKKKLTKKELQTLCRKSKNVSCSINYLVEDGTIKMIERIQKTKKAKDVKAFNDETVNTINDIDWDKMIQRNIFMKLSTIFEAMGWDLNEIRQDMPSKIPEIKPEPTQIKKIIDKPIGIPLEVKKEPKRLGINVLSLFDGMSCGQMALERANITVNKYYSSEIDKYAIQVTQKNYPNTIQLGDIVKLKGCNLPKIDLLIGGSPCQGFSFAGKGLNFNAPRSKLFFEYVRLLKELKPKYFLLENVVMKQQFQNVITKELRITPIKINSSLVSAQNRNRLYWTNIPNITQPKDKNLVLKDIILEKNINKLKTFMKGNFQTYMLDLGITTFLGEKGHLVDITMKKNLTLTNQYRVKHVMPLQGKSRCLTTSCQYMTGRGGTGLFINGIHRNLNIIECERLQTIPDNYTSDVVNGQRHKMIGNGWTIDIIAHIFKNIVIKGIEPKTTEIKEIRSYYEE